MAKTKIQLELEEKKREEKINKKAELYSRQNRQEKPKTRRKMSQQGKTRLIVTGICVVTLASVIAVAIGKNSGKTVDNDSASTGINIDDKYIVDADGNITFLNGDEIMSAFPDNYVMSIKTSDVNGSNEYKAEVMGEVMYYYGTENGEKFSEAQIELPDKSIYLCKTADGYTETYSLHHAYIDGKNIAQAILFGDNIKKDDNKYSSDIRLDLISGIFPAETETETEISGNEYEDTDVDYTPVYVNTEIYATKDIIYISGSNKDTSFSIEIKEISEMSENFSAYMPVTDSEE